MKKAVVATDPSSNEVRASRTKYARGARGTGDARSYSQLEWLIAELAATPCTGP